MTVSAIQMPANVDATVMVSKKEVEKIRLVLPGGGVRGTFQLAFLQELLKSGKYEIDRVYGTSMGAILAPFAVCNKLDKLRDFFQSVTNIADVASPWSWAWGPLKLLAVLFKLGAYQKFNVLDEALKHFDEADREHFHKCHVVAWDITKRQEVWFSGAKLDIGMKASSALWLAVPPVPYEGSLLTDGGVTQNYPLTKAVEDAKRDGFKGKVILVDSSKRSMGPMKSTPSNALFLMAELLHCTTEYLAMRDLELARLALGDQLVVVRPSEDFFNNSFDFEQQKMEQSYKHGSSTFYNFLQSEKSDKVVVVA